LGGVELIFRIDKPSPIGRRVRSVTLQRIILSAGLLALIGVGSFSPSVALAQTNRPPKSGNPPQRKLSARQIAERTAPSVVLLVTTDEADNPIALGSGFFVETWLIATNYHVIKDASQIYVKIVGQKGRYKISGVSTPDEQNDLVLLKVDDVEGHPLKLVTSVGREDNYMPIDKVAFIGCDGVIDRVIEGIGALGAVLPQTMRR